jgi:hypothetical protein
LDSLVGTAGGDTFLGLVSSTAANSTLSLGDVINGGAGTDNLNITTDTATVNMAVATVSNVANLDVNMDATAAPGTAGTAQNAGTVNLNSVAYTKATIEGVTGDDATNTNSDTLTVNNANLATRIVLEDVTDAASTVNFVGAAGNSDEATVEVAGSTETTGAGINNDLTVANVETLNLAFTTAANDLNIVTATDAKTVNVTVASDADTTIRGAAVLTAATAVNIAAAGSLTLGATAALANDAVITVSGAGDVDLNTLDNNGATDGVTVAASTMTGGLTVTGGAHTVSITSGAGADVVTAGGIITAVSLGDGDDKFDTAGNDFGGATAVNVDGGDGIDTIVIDDGSELDAASAAHFKNFEILDVVGGTGTYDLDVLEFATVNVSGDLAADVVIDNITNETLNITGSVDNTGGITYDLKDNSGGTDALTVNIQGVFSNAGTPTDTTDDANDVTVDELVFGGIETVTLNSGDNAAHTAGVNNTVTLLDTDATKLILTGDHALTITAFEQDVDAATTGTVNTSIATIDASASAGLVMGAAVSTTSVSILGSEFADTILIGTVTGAAAGTETGSTINAGKGGDIIDLTGGLTLTGTGAVDTLIINAGDSKIGFVDTDNDGSYATASDAETFDVVTGFTSTEDTIDLGSFGFTGQKASALANGTLAAGAATGLVDGTTPAIANFFLDTGTQRGVTKVDNYDASAIGGTTGSTLVFIDTDGDGNLNIANDEMIVVSGTAALVLSDFGF